MSFLVILGVIAISVLVYQIYKIKNDPLSRFPGPRSWALSRIPYVSTLIAGRLPVRIKELHEEYGPVVRTAPNEVSFIDEKAWDDIYTGQLLNKGFPKNDVIAGAQGYPSIIDAHDHQHTEIRKLLNPQFSTRMIREREALYRKYIDLLIHRLCEKVDAGVDERTEASQSESCAVVDIVKWLNFFTFDVTGEAIYSESFGCLSEQTYHPWISLVLDHLSGSSLLITARFYTPLDKIIDWTLDNFFPSLSEQKAMFKREAYSKGQRRLQRNDENLDDLMTALQSDTSSPMDSDNLKGNATLLSIAGSETSATVLASVFVCMQQGHLTRLTAEIRGIEKEEDLTLGNLEKLSYLTAIIMEALRLGTPLPTGLPRVIPAEGALVMGHYLPGGTIVGVSQVAAYYSEYNFYKPTEFLPERWLPDEASRPEFKNDKRDVFKPFFVGARNCVGQTAAWAQMRLAIGHILWNFDVQRLSDFRWIEQQCYYLWRKEQCWIELKPARKA